MKTLFIVLFFIILLCFIPIPITLKAVFNPNDYYIKLYKFFIIKKGKKPKKEPPKEEEKPSEEPPKKNEEKEKKSKLNFFKERISFIILYRNVRDNIHKPRLRVKGHLQYSLGDAAKTAISYGAISALAPVIYRGITLFFRSKKFYLPIKPLVDKDATINFEVNCIIFISIAQIINMFYIIFISILETQEDKINEQ
ncbi:MAG: DUF2953 domain-containing protein [Clostridium sp.]